MNTVNYNYCKLHGETGKLIDNIIDKWIIGLRETNPAIIDMFADRDIKPYRNLLPWSGEFAGKYITGAYFCYKLTGNRDLYDYITNFIDELISYQDIDGYLGCFSKECRLTGAYSQNPSVSGHTWDSWGHYHIMYGLLLWYGLTKNEKYFETVKKTAEFYLNKFYGDNPPLVAIGSTEMNLSVYHVFGILYSMTKEKKYLDFAVNIENDLSDADAGDYINYSLKGYEFYQCPRPRWESLHVIMGFVDMYRNTQNKQYLDVASQIFFSILKTDVHNTGAFSTDEQAIGHPYKNSNIETCCVIAYNALAIEIFRELGDLKIIEFLERSHYNAILGYNSPSGKWSTYNTPMDGTKNANYHDINFQCRPGSPDLNCCSVNAPRGVANLSEWLLTENENGLYLNFYEALSLETETGLTLKISGNYPTNNKVKIQIDSNGKKQKLSFRIPAWSKNTTVSIGGDIYSAQAGTYFALDKVWDDELEITFDLSCYTEPGDMDYLGKSSIYVGPVLYGLDATDNPYIDFENPPTISLKELSEISPKLAKDGSTTLTLSNGIVLKDFYHLGTSGSFYKTWLKTE